MFHSLFSSSLISLAFMAKFRRGSCDVSNPILEVLASEPYCPKYPACWNFILGSHFSFQVKSVCFFSRPGFQLFLFDGVHLHLDVFPDDIHLGRLRILHLHSNTRVLIPIELAPDFSTDLDANRSISSCVKSPDFVSRAWSRK